MSMSIKTKDCGCQTVDSEYFDIKEVTETLCDLHEQEVFEKKWIGREIVADKSYGIATSFIERKGKQFILTDSDNAVPFDIYVNYLAIKNSHSEVDGGAYSKRSVGVYSPSSRKRKYPN